MFSHSLTCRKSNCHRFFLNASAPDASTELTHCVVSPAPHATITCKTASVIQPCCYGDHRHTCQWWQDNLYSEVTPLMTEADWITQFDTRLAHAKYNYVTRIKPAKLNCFYAFTFWWLLWLKTTWPKAHGHRAVLAFRAPDTQHAAAVVPPAIQVALGRQCTCVMVASCNGDDGYICTTMQWSLNGPSRSSALNRAFKDDCLACVVCNKGAAQSAHAAQKQHWFKFQEQI